MKTIWLSAGQAAKRLNVSLETVYNMCRDGRLGGRYSRGNGKSKGSWMIAVSYTHLSYDRGILMQSY